MPSYATALLAAAPLLLLLLLSLPAPSRGVEIKWTPGEDRGMSGSDGIGGALGVGGDSDGASAAPAAGSTDAAASSTEATTSEDGSGGSGGGGGAGGSGNYDPPTSGPLPLSQNQRNQLTQLEQTIMSSPDPRSTLLQVAESNGMAPEELVDLLQRNRQDMEMAAGGGRGGGGMGAGRTLPRRLFGLFGTVLAAVGKMASSHPRNFTLLATALLLVAYAAIQAPRTGIVTSTRPKPLGLSSGYTTFLSPPAPFVASYLNSNQYYNLPSSLPKSVKVGSLSRRIADAVMAMEDDGVLTERLKRKSKLGLSVTARRTVPIGALVPRGPSKSRRRREAEDDDDEDEDGDDIGDDDDEELLTYAAYVAHDAATSVLSSRRYSEFAVSDSQRRADLRFQSSGGKKDEAMLIVGGMGDLGRYGLQPLRLAFEEEEGPDVRTVAFHTLRGGHFDGEVRFSVERRVVGGREHTDEEEGEDREEQLDRIESVIISVSLVVPRKGRKPSKKLAERVVSTLADSILTSVETEARQTIARQTMSQRYRGRMEGRATERRHLRYLNEKKMEEMSEDRRRRWQRRNPDSGRYRPSGVRMRSPNNC